MERLVSGETEATGTSKQATRRSQNAEGTLYSLPYEYSKITMQCIQMRAMLYLQLAWISTSRP